MDKLTKTQKDEYATAFAILALYDGGADVTADQINALLDATGNSVEPFYPIIFANFLSNPQKLAEIIAVPAAGGGGSGLAGPAAGSEPAAAEEVKEEEKEEEEMDLGGGMDMFGGDEGGGGGGDY